MVLTAVGSGEILRSIKLPASLELGSGLEGVRVTFIHVSGQEYPNARLWFEARGNTIPIAGFAETVRDVVSRNPQVNITTLVLGHLLRSVNTTFETKYDSMEVKDFGAVDHTTSLWRLY